MNSINNVNRLLEDIAQKLGKWDERRSFSLKGIKNLSLSDMETLIFYCNRYPGFNGLMEPMGNIKQVLIKYKVIEG